jgi:hypothetical protein
MGYKLDELPRHLTSKIRGAEVGGQAEKKPMVKIGIDPGTHTGLAIFDVVQRELIEVTSGTIIECYHAVLEWTTNTPHMIVIEDASKRKWFGKKSAAKAQGAGSIKRDCKIWKEICEENNLTHRFVHPIKGATKIDAGTFEKMTGWTGRTNEHGRDAGLMVYEG